MIYSLNMVFFAELWVNSHIAIENGQIVDLPSSKMAIVHSDVGLPEGKQKKMGNDWPCPQPANRPCLQFAGSNWQLGGWVSAIEATWLGFMYDMYWYVPKFMAHYGTFSSRAWRCFEDMMHFFFGKAGLFFLVGSPGNSSTPGIESPAWKDWHVQESWNGCSGSWLARIDCTIWYIYFISV